MVMCGCSSQGAHQFISNMVDKYDDGSFDQLFKKYRQETNHDNDKASRLLLNELVKDLVSMRNRSAERESFKSGQSRSHASTSSKYAQSTDALGVPLIVPRKKRSGSGSEGFIPKRSSSSSDDNTTRVHHHVLHQEDEAAKISTVSSRKEAGGASGVLGFVDKNKHSKTRSTSDHEEKKLEGGKKKKGVISTNKKRCFDIIKENVEGKKSTSKRRKSDEKDLGFDYSDEIKALIGEDGDEDFKLRIRKILFATDLSRHHDRFTMPCRQINECENLLNDEEKGDIRIGNGVGVTLVELGLGDKRDGRIASQLRLKQWDMGKSSSYALRSSWNNVIGRISGVLQIKDYVQIYSFRRNKKLWLVLIKESDHVRGRTVGVFGSGGL